MDEVAGLAILFSVGCIAGAINVMAGSGSALTLPALIFLGLDAGVANGTNRVAILIQNISALASFRSEGVSELCQSVKFAVWTLPGAVAGAFAAVQVTDVWFERILGVVLIGVVLSMIIPRPEQRSAVGTSRSAWVCVALFGIGFYGGFIQVGVGFLLMAVFFHLLKMDLVRTTLHKVTVILLFTVPALLIFAVAGQVNWLMGLVLAAGNGTGAWIAARTAVRKGERAVRLVLIIAVLGMAARILKLF